MKQDPIQREWENVQANPDMEDLGYYLLDLEVISTATESEQVIILPRDESLLKDDAFILAHESAVYDLDDWT